MTRAPAQCGNPRCGCMLPPDPDPPRYGLAVAIVLVGLVLSCLLAGRTCAQAPMRGPSGEPGVWLPLELSREVLEAYSEAPTLRERMGLLGRSLELREVASLELRAALSAAESEAHLAWAALDTVREARERAERRARRRLGLAAGGSALGLLAGLLAGFLSGG